MDKDNQNNKACSKKNGQNDKNGDVHSRDGCETWFYSDTVKDHFFNPRNFLKKDPTEGEYDGFGKVGSPACGDCMATWIKVDQETNKIIDFKWRTFGCCSAIAATSMLSVMVTENGGMEIEKAKKIKPQHIIERLAGLPNRKIHCSVLCNQALGAAIDNHESQVSVEK